MLPSITIDSFSLRLSTSIVADSFRVRGEDPSSPRGARCKVRKRLSNSRPASRSRISDATRRYLTVDRNDDGLDARSMECHCQDDKAEAVAKNALHQAMDGVGKLGGECSERLEGGANAAANRAMVGRRTDAF
jgi:hypothetical protein